ncbi:MAG: SRPBCC family protein [Bacteroidales bacterium]|nr:SRPBCC family protein [Bacteroidales bacterium]
MKNLLRLLFILLFLVIVLIIFGLFLPGKHKIVVRKAIDVPAEIVFPLVNDFRNWNSWSPWLQNDTSMIVKTEKHTSGKGARLSWESEKYGNCIVIITHCIEPESIAINFDYGTKSQTNSLWNFLQTDEGTQLEWTISLERLSIWERYFVLFNKNRMRQLIVSGADELEELAITFSRSRIGEIQMARCEARPVIVMSDSVLAANVPARMQEMFAYLNTFFQRRKLEASGNPIAVFYGVVSDSLFKFDCAIPVTERTWVWQTLRFYQMPATNVVSVSHFGYPTDKAHRAILKYIEANKLEANGFPFEEYLYDAQSDIDTVSWETKVYYPVK